MPVDDHNRPGHPPQRQLCALDELRRSAGLAGLAQCVSRSPLAGGIIASRLYVRSKTAGRSRTAGGDRPVGRARRRGPPPRRTAPSVPEQSRRGCWLGCWCRALVDRVHDLGVIDATQVHGRDPEVGMPERRVSQGSSASHAQRSIPTSGSASSSTGRSAAAWTALRSVRVTVSRPSLPPPGGRAVSTSFTNRRVATRANLSSDYEMGRDAARIPVGSCRLRLAAVARCKRAVSAANARS